MAEQETKRYALINQQTDEIRVDKLMTDAELLLANEIFAAAGLPWKFLPYAEPNNVGPGLWNWKDRESFGVPCGNEKSKP